MSSPSRKKTRTTSAGDAMKLVAKPEPALTYAARDSFAFSEGESPSVSPTEAEARPEAPATVSGPARYQRTSSKARTE